MSTLRSLRVAALSVCLWSLSLARVGGVWAQVPGADLPPPPASVGSVDVPPVPSSPPTAAAPTSPEDVRTAMVIDAATRGIDPRVGQHVTLVMRQTITALGYAVASDTDTVLAAQRMRMPYPPALADLWRVTLVAGVDRTAFARVWADSGRYVYEITIASADGTGPFQARGTSGAEDLYTVVERLTRAAMPPPSAWDAGAAARYRVPTAVEPLPAPAVGQLGPPAQGSLGPAAPFVRPMTPAESRTSEALGRRVQLALFSGSAIGADGNRFYNHLIELSVGLRLRRNIILSLQLGYANLRGRDRRENNLLPMLVVERRIRLGQLERLSVPIKGGVGFLPFNGPVLRVSAGVTYAITERIELNADLLCPSFWVVGSDVFVSMNLALGLIVRL